MSLGLFYNYQKPHDILSSNFVFLRKQFRLSSQNFAWYYFQISTKQLAGKGTDA
uniref:Uncharacterized protein n=1 Tax=Arundo donax TaxID=35708 RepID=A0A0A9A775_ARUDO